MICLYRTPSETNIESFLTELSRVCGSGQDGYVDILLGDFNIDIGSEARNEDTKVDYLIFLSELGFVPCINQFTRVDKESSSCLDHIFLRCKRGIPENSFSIVWQTSITDHFSTLLYLASLTTPKHDDRNRHKYVRRTDYGKLITDLESEAWSNVYNSDDVDSAAQSFHDTLKRYTDNCTRVVSQSHRVTALKPWMRLAY